MILVLLTLLSLPLLPLLLLLLRLITWLTRRLKSARDSIPISEWESKTLVFKLTYHACSSIFTVFLVGWGVFDLQFKQEACRPIQPADCWNYDRSCNHNLVINQSYSQSVSHHPWPAIINYDDLPLSSSMIIIISHHSWSIIINKLSVMFFIIINQWRKSMSISHNHDPWSSLYDHQSINHHGNYQN